ncbi:MAG: hypothetical protein MUC61_01610 [Amoebophilaceae bacterium]|jgi:hypothetical protein|nr:hypothetical protein [Amoebophilaceae bacterium]
MFPALVKEVSSFNKVIACNPCKNLHPRALRTTLLSDIAPSSTAKEYSGDAGNGDQFVLQ